MSMLKFTRIVLFTEFKWKMKLIVDQIFVFVSRFNEIWIFKMKVNRFLVLIVFLYNSIYNKDNIIPSYKNNLLINWFSIISVKERKVEINSCYWTKIFQENKGKHLEQSFYGMNFYPKDIGKLHYATGI